MTYPNENLLNNFPSDQVEGATEDDEGIDDSTEYQFDQSDLQDHVTSIKEEAVEAYAKPWQNKMDALRRNVRSLHPDLQDKNWLFRSNNLCPQ
ncbi:hypothetical protein PVK06_027783 [Gossypium arboreum]|uniref:Uncharacterized protein n=1 Tax=Gossypium arboreum TaxID=29729 RepID=A0ABR0P2K0_GOSAR|nr:hypothetical protein PVK06_027783 [Gossypium arboreum]